MKEINDGVHETRQITQQRQYTVCSWTIVLISENVWTLKVCIIWLYEEILMYASTPNMSLVPVNLGW